MKTKVTRKIPIVFNIGDDRVIGMIHRSAETIQSIGVLIAVGGPQYRVGSHRQFLLLARHLALNGIATMRFDYRGMGDSEGEQLGFENSGPEIVAATDEFLRRCPEVKKIILWGLCDAASTIAMHSHKDNRVAGMLLVNPWVRSETGLAQTYVKQYYWRRFLAPDFWQKMASGNLNFGETVRSVIKDIEKAFRSPGSSGNDNQGTELSGRMADGLLKFKGQVHIILSGQDLTALEFEQTSSGSMKWGEVFSAPQVLLRRLPDANHTFSRREWRQQVFEWTVALVRGI